MEIGMIGLGRMGAGMSRRIMKGGHRCVVFDTNSDNIKALEKDGAVGASSIEDLVQKLHPPRAIWMMLPLQGIEFCVEKLPTLLSKGDVLIDGGNSFFKDDVRRSTALAENGIHYLDVGTSGGIWGNERGYCLMIGGDESSAKRLQPIFESLAPGGGPETKPSQKGFLYCGPSGAGHFAKMVHNGIEYGMMQAYAEGLDLLKNAERLPLGNNSKYDFDITELTEVWRHGSVITSWLLDLTAEALAKNSDLSRFTGSVPDTGEGRWAASTAIELAVPAPTLCAALFTRFRSRSGNTFGEKILSLMREKFGGHQEK